MNNTSSIENSMAYNLFNTAQPIKMRAMFRCMCTGCILVWYRNCLTKEGRGSRSLA